MKLKSKCLLTILLISINLNCVFAGVIAIGKFNKSNSDSPTKSIPIKQIIVKNNQRINRNVFLGNISLDQNPDLIISSNISYEVTQDNETNAVEFLVTPRAYLKISKHGKMIFNNSTRLHLTANSTLEISDSSILEINNKSQLIIDSGAVLIIRGTGNILCTDSSIININPFSNLILQHKNSRINMINGSVFITRENFIVTYQGEGKVFIDKKEYYSNYGK